MNTTFLREIENAFSFLTRRYEFQLVSYDYSNAGVLVVFENPWIRIYFEYERFSCTILEVSRSEDPVYKNHYPIDCILDLLEEQYPGPIKRPKKHYYFFEDGSLRLDKTPIGSYGTVLEENIPYIMELFKEENYKRTKNRLKEIMDNQK